MSGHTDTSRSAERVAVLDGERAVAYATYGDPSGRPLLVLHGTPGSHVLGELFDDAARRHGVRVLAPDRPGYGQSPAWPSRALPDTAEFVAAVLDDADVRSADVVGFSGGAPHALALAATDPGLVDGVDVVAGAAPPALRRETPPTQRFLAWTARRVPALLGALTRAQVSVAERAPASFVLAQYTDAAGRRAVSDAEADVVRRDFLAALRHRRDGLACELRMLAEPWGFSLDDVAAPVRLWHGADDANAPVAAARRVADALPDCETTVYDDADHLTTLLRSRRAVLDVAAASAG
jgi:pimeloyl-ACP methyl ester carboxylesterase